MPTDEIVKIRAKVTTSRSRLLDEVEGLQGQQWEWHSADDRWSARQTLSHVGSAERSHLQVARSIFSRTAVDLPEFDLNTWNVVQVAKRDGWTPDEVLADLREAHEETLAFLDGLDSEMLTLTGRHPALGEVSVGQVLRIIALHDGMHRRDIARLRAEMRQAATPTQGPGTD
ncbi:DinB family protein [Chloroflexota bacterium]